MSLTNSCYDTLHPLLSAESQTNSELPALFWSEAGCTGTRYPPEGEYNLWEQNLPLSQMGMDTIESFYIPPHAMLELWSTVDGFQTIHGPAVIGHAPSHLGFWRHADNSPCVDSHKVECGTRIPWIIGSLPGQITRMRLTRVEPWHDYFDRHASTNTDIVLGSKTLPTNPDQFYTDMCGTHSHRYRCDCHLAHQQLIVDHGEEIASQTHVNLLQNSCDALAHYVPSGAKTGIGANHECQAHFRAQIENGTFKFLDQGGDATILCNGHYYTNLNSDGTYTELEQVDDDEEDRIEAKEMSQPMPLWIFYVIAGVLTFAWLMFMVHMSHKTFWSKSSTLQKRWETIT